MLLACISVLASCQTVPPSPPYHHSPISFLLILRNNIPSLLINRARVHKMLVQKARIFDNVPFHRPRDRNIVDQAAKRRSYSAGPSSSPVHHPPQMNNVFAEPDTTRVRTYQHAESTPHPGCLSNRTTLTRPSHSLGRHQKHTKHLAHPTQPTRIDLRYVHRFRLE